MEQKAHELAKMLLDSGQEFFQTDFEITDKDGNATSETIVITARKIKTPLVQQFRQMMERYIPSASGSQCPKCKGTGRV